MSNSNSSNTSDFINIIDLFNEYVILGYNNLSKFPFWVLDSLDSSQAMLYELIKSKKHPVNFMYDFVQECKKNNYFKK